MTSIKVGSTTLLSSVTYDPFGPATGWTWGNNTPVTRAFDQDGNPHQIVTAGVTNGYTVDAASRITGITDSGLSSATWNFTSYDALDRIKVANSSALSRGYTYDANSNRLTTTGTTASTETIASTSNRLSSTAGGIVRTYGYDAAGNTTSYGGTTFTYNKRGRISSTSAGSNSYTYNALGQMIAKVNSTATTLFMYDEQGHLLGEYTGAGALIEETIWMGDTPVATLRPNGSTVAIYYVHTDHLGTARKVTRPSDNGLMWRFDPDTFGSVAPNQNPAGLGGFVYNLGFPGQYLLTETGLYYNYFRTYDPQMGRYLESDPIGLAGGGINPYAYVEGNPISYIDPLGLELIQVTLPGLGTTYLDDSFYPLVQQFITNAAAQGVNLQFNSAYRTPGHQAALRNDPNAITPANQSLHSCGFAVDVNYSVLPARQQSVIRNAATAAGLNWGGNFTPPDPPHFYIEPSIPRATAIQNATLRYLLLNGQP